ncbi:hypothetical protein X975_22650, partial [Stegodyphus mimosarum]
MYMVNEVVYQGECGLGTERHSLRLLHCSGRNVQHGFDLQPRCYQHRQVHSSHATY